MQRIPAREVPALLARLAEKGPRPQWLDVREPWEVALARVDCPGVDGRYIPLRDLPGRLAELDAQRPLLVLCHHGVRSLQATLFLWQHGYPHAYNIEGGIDAWSREVDPTVARY